MANEANQTYESVVMGLPALKMVLVHAKNEAQNAEGTGTDRHLHTPRPKKKIEQSEKEQVVRKIIQHLESVDQ
jgi:hypothetical protein